MGSRDEPFQAGPGEPEDAALVGGGLVTIRPISPSDGPALVAFHASLTSWSIYLRYFGAHPRLSDWEVEKFTHVDYRDRLALVAECEGSIVGVGRYDRTAGGAEAEVAFVVADAFQGRGIGTLLLHGLAEPAKRNGIHTFVADVLAENRTMLDVFAQSGFDVHTSACHEVVHVTFDIGGERGRGRLQGAPSVPADPKAAHPGDFR